MPKHIVDKKMILNRAWNIAESQGLEAVNIRAVATACGVSVGSIYNYYPAKADLTADVIKHFFKLAFFDDFCHPQADETYLAFSRRLFETMQKALARFRSDWLAQIMRLPQSDLEASKSLEAQQLAHVEHGLLLVFENDPTIDRNALPANLDPQKLCHLTLTCMIASIRSGENDCETFFALIEAALYR